MLLLNYAKTLLINLVAFKNENLIIMNRKKKSRN